MSPQRANSKSARHLGKTPGGGAATIDQRKLWSDEAEEFAIRFAISHALLSV